MRWLLGWSALVLVTGLARLQDLQENGDASSSVIYGRETSAKIPTTTEINNSKTLSLTKDPRLSSKDTEESSNPEISPSSTLPNQRDSPFEGPPANSSLAMTQSSIDLSPAAATSVEDAALPSSPSSEAYPPIDKDRPSPAESASTSGRPSDTQVNESTWSTAETMPTVNGKLEGSTSTFAFTESTMSSAKIDDKASEDKNSSFATTPTSPTESEVSTEPSTTPAGKTVHGRVFDLENSSFPPFLQPDEPTVLSKKEHTMLITFQYNCSPSENQLTLYKENLLNSTLAKNAGITNVRVDTTQCFSTFVVNVTYNEEQFLSDLENNEMVELRVLNRSYFVRVSSHPHHDPFSRREMMLFIIVGAVLGLVILSTLLIFCIKCFARRKSETGLPTAHSSLKDRPRFTLDMEGMSLTRIPRPALSVDGIRGDDGMIQPFDTSVVPMEDAQKLDDIRRYRQGDMPELTLRTFDSKRSSQWKNESDSKERLAPEGGHRELIRNGVENPTYAKF